MGFVLGNEKAYETFEVTKAEKYAHFLKKLWQVVWTSPQDAYACFTRGVQQK